ncbi:hypothetical protein [Halorhabdus amylolytica]|uniref:hypothetical protein n=1 Tax=Halorhabdus amylolytica TaxID=2559573 RepID=UPI0010AA3179|nr:hypothetical protein [Halorhabdus amylolytica]
MAFDREHVLPFALLVVVVSGGCLAPIGGAAESTPTAADATERQAPDDASAGDAEDGPRESGTDLDDSRSGPGLAEAISTNGTLDRSEITYYPDNDTIRYVAAYHHTNHEEVVNGTAPPDREPIYEFVPAEEWLAVQAPYAGADAVREQVTSRLAGNHSLSTGVSSADNGTRVTVATRTLLSRDGEVLSTPNVTFDRIQTVTPTNVTVTISVGEHSLTRTYPVEVRRMVLQQE